MDTYRIYILEQLKEHVLLEDAMDRNGFMCNGLDDMNAKFMSQQSILYCEAIRDVQSTITDGIEGEHTFNTWLRIQLIGAEPEDDWTGEYAAKYEVYVRWMNHKIMNQCRMAWIDRMIAGLQS